MGELKSSNTDTEAPEVLTMGEVAELLRVSSRTVSRLARAKKMPGKKIGKEWRFYRGDVEKYLKS